MYYDAVVASWPTMGGTVKHWHMLICGAFVIGGIALAVAGVSGVVAFLPVLGCVAMMGAMMLMMGRGAKS